MDTKAAQLSSNGASLVTGGAGFIGSNLCRRMLSKGERVIAVDNLITGRRSNIEDLEGNQKFKFLFLDITSQKFSEALGGIAVKRVYHLACPTGVPNISRLAEEMLLTCSVGSRNVFELARVKGASVLVASTAEIYGQPEVVPQAETYAGNVNPVGMRSPYEEGKRFMESLAIMYVRKHNSDIKIVRIFNTYGPGMSLEDERVLPHFLKCVVEKKKLRIYGTGMQTRTHMYIDDTISGIETVVERGKTGEVYNIGGEAPTTIKELASLVIEHTGHAEGICHEPHFIEDHDHRQPCTEKIKSLGWRQKVRLKDGVKMMILANGIACADPILREAAQIS